MQYLKIIRTSNKWKKEYSDFEMVLLLIFLVDEVIVAKDLYYEWKWLLNESGFRSGNATIAVVRNNKVFIKYAHEVCDDYEIHFDVEGATCFSTSVSEMITILKEWKKFKEKEYSEISFFKEGDVISITSLPTKKDGK